MPNSLRWLEIKFLFGLHRQTKSHFFFNYIYFNVKTCNKQFSIQQCGRYVFSGIEKNASSI